jgi:hypothetical protein
MPWLANKRFGRLGIRHMATPRRFGMVQVDIALPADFGGPPDQPRCNWAGEWCGRFLGVESHAGQRIERFTFGGDGDATLFAHATCHRLEVWTDGCRGQPFTVTVNGERILPGTIGSRRQS